MARLTSLGHFSIHLSTLAAAELNSRGVLTNAELKDVLNEQEDKERTTALVHAIDCSLSRDSTGAGEVIETFEAIKKCSDLVEEAVRVETCEQAPIEPHLPELYRQQGPTLDDKASELVELFKSLCEALSRAGDNVNAGKVRKIVQEDFVNLAPNASAYLMKQLEHKHSVDDILQSLITAGFCSHLGYRFFLKASEFCSSKRLKKELKDYQEKYEAFCKEITLSDLYQTLTSNQAFQLTMSSGTPFLVVQLSGPWPKLRFHTAQVTIASILPWVSDLQLQAVEESQDVSLVYCGFKSAITSLIRDLQKPGVAPALEELGITVDLRMKFQPISYKTGDLTTADSSVQTTELEEVEHQDEDDEKQVQKKLMSLEVEQDEDQPSTDKGSYWENRSSQLVTKLTADEVYQILTSYRRPNTEEVKQEFLVQMETRQKFGVHPKVVVEKDLDEVAQESSLKVKDLEAQLLKKDDTISQLISATVSELTKSLKEREKENETQLRCLQEKMDSLESKLKDRAEQGGVSEQLATPVPPEKNHSDRDTKSTLSSEGSVVFSEEETYCADNFDITAGHNVGLVEFVVGFDKKPHVEH